MDISVCVFFYSRLNSRLYLSLLMYHFIKHLNHFIYCRKSFKKMSNWTETAKNLELNREISSNSTFLLRISDPGDNLIFLQRVRRKPLIRQKNSWFLKNSLRFSTLSSARALHMSFYFNWLNHGFYHRTMCVEIVHRFS